MTQIVRNAVGQTQVRKTRKDGWTRKKRTIFLDHLAATCNITAAASAAGMTVRGVHALRRRDPVFAELWTAAMHEGYDTLEAELLRHAIGDVIAENPDDFDGTRADAPPAAFDPELAMRLLTQRDRHGSPERRHGGGRRVSKQVSIEEVEAKLIKVVEAAERRIARSKGGGVKVAG